MPRKHKKYVKRSMKQRNSTAQARETAQSQHRNPLGDITNHVHNTSLAERVVELEEQMKFLKLKVKNANQRWYSEKRRNERLRKAAEARKADLKAAKAEVYQLRRAAERLDGRMKAIREDAEEAIARLKDRIGKMEVAQKDLNQRRVILWKRCKRLTAAKAALKIRMAEMRKSRPSTFRMMRKGRYTPQARSLARLLVASGTAERRVGGALQQIGGILGVGIRKSLSARSVQRFVLEEGVAADIQLVYEIIKSASKWCYHQKWNLD